MKFIIASLILILFHPQWKRRDASLINGIWIPSTIDWQHPQFNTYCFANDTTVVIISSIQRKEADSIIFKAEGTSTVRIGFLKRVSADRFLIYENPARGDASAGVRGIRVKVRPGETDVLIGGTLYQRAFQYTEAGKEEVYRIVMKVINRDLQATLP